MNFFNCYSIFKGYGGVRGGIIINIIFWYIYLVSDVY